MFPISFFFVPGRVRSFRWIQGSKKEKTEERSETDTTMYGHHHELLTWNNRICPGRNLRGSGCTMSSYETRSDRVFIEVFLDLNRSTDEVVSYCRICKLLLLLFERHYKDSIVWEWVSALYRISRLFLWYLEPKESNSNVRLWLGPV